MAMLERIDAANDVLQGSTGFCTPCGGAAPNGCQACGAREAEVAGWDQSLGSQVCDGRGASRERRVPQCLTFPCA